ncbi:MAG: phasin family protein [Hyphococcus sp.]
MTAATKTAAKTTATAANTVEKQTEDAMNVASDITAAAQDQIQKMVDMAADNAEEMRAQTETMVDDLRARFEKTQKHMADANAEIVEAARTEVTDAVQFANDLASAKTFADALDIQQKYWTSLFNTRVERAQEMTQSAVDVARESMQPVNASMTAMFDPSKMFANLFPTKA